MQLPQQIYAQGYHSNQGGLHGEGIKDVLVGAYNGAKNIYNKVKDFNEGLKKSKVISNTGQKILDSHIGSIMKYLPQTAAYHEKAQNLVNKAKEYGYGNKKKGKKSKKNKKQKK